MFVPRLAPHFLAMLLMSVLLFSMVLETKENTRFLEALGVFILAWASIVSYAIADKTARASKSI